MNYMNENDEIIEPISFVTDIDEFWVKTIRDITGESIKRIEEAAKQLIAIVSVLQAIYFAAISFSELKNLSFHNPWSFLFICPIAIWIISLSLAVTVFMPRTYSTNLESPSMSEKTFKEMVKFKQRQLWYAYCVLVAGFIVLIISITFYLYYLK